MYRDYYNMDKLCDMSFEIISSHRDHIIDDIQYKVVRHGILHDEYEKDGYRHHRYTICIHNLEYNKDGAYMIFKSIYQNYTAIQQIKIILLFIAMKCNVDYNFINTILNNLSLCDMNDIEFVLNNHLFDKIIEMYPNNSFLDYILNNGNMINNICELYIRKNKLYYYINVLSFLTYNGICVNTDMIDNIIRTFKVYLTNKKNYGYRKNILIYKNILKYLNHKNPEMCKEIFKNDIEFLKYLCVNSDLDEKNKKTFLKKLNE